MAVRRVIVGTVYHLRGVIGDGLFVNPEMKSLVMCVWTILSAASSVLRIYALLWYPPPLPPMVRHP